jgi:Ca2+-binding EF-hand superfamily protein
MDFCRMLLSASPEYNELYCLEGRRKGGVGEISGKARETMRGIMSELMKFEAELEGLRGKLREKEVDLRGLFREMDVDQSECITLNDLKQFLGGYKVFPSLFELVAIIELLDGKRDGKIDYSEFLESLSPKSIPHTEANGEI